MAEGLARATAPDGWLIYSAGSDPGLVHPLAVEAMREVDIDIRTHRSKGTDEIPLDEADVIVTLCSEEVCPTVHGNAERLNWPLPDPAAEREMIRYQVDAFRSVRDEIKRRLESFWTEYAPKS
jgi:arsenate reductase